MAAVLGRPTDSSASGNANRPRPSSFHATSESSRQPHIPTPIPGSPSSSAAVSRSGSRRDIGLSALTQPRPNAPSASSLIALFEQATSGKPKDNSGDSESSHHSTGTVGASTAATGLEAPPRTTTPQTPRRTGSPLKQSIIQSGAGGGGDGDDNDDSSDDDHSSNHDRPSENSDNEMDSRVAIAKQGYIYHRENEQDWTRLYAIAFRFPPGEDDSTPSLQLFADADSTNLAPSLNLDLNLATAAVAIRTPPTESTSSPSRASPISSDEEGTRYPFDVVVQERTIHFAAESPIERVRWLSVLRALMEYNPAVERLLEQARENQQRLLEQQVLETHIARQTGEASPYSSPIRQRQSTTGSTEHSREIEEGTFLMKSPDDSKVPSDNEEENAEEPPKYESPRRPRSVSELLRGVRSSRPSTPEKPNRSKTPDTPGLPKVPHMRESDASAISELQDAAESTQQPSTRAEASSLMGPLDLQTLNSRLRSTHSDLHHLHANQISLVSELRSEMRNQFRTTIENSRALRGVLERVVVPRLEDIRELGESMGRVLVSRQGASSGWGTSAYDTGFTTQATTNATGTLARRQSRRKRRFSWHGDGDENATGVSQVEVGEEQPIQDEDDDRDVAINALKRMLVDIVASPTIPEKGKEREVEEEDPQRVATMETMQHIADTAPSTREGKILSRSKASRTSRGLGRRRSYSFGDSGASAQPAQDRPWWEVAGEPEPEEEVQGLDVRGGLSRQGSVRSILGGAERILSRRNTRAKYFGTVPEEGASSSAGQPPTFQSADLSRLITHLTIQDAQAQARQMEMSSNLDSFTQDASTSLSNIQGEMATRLPTQEERMIMEDKIDRVMNVATWIFESQQKITELLEGTGAGSRGLRNRPRGGAATGIGRSRDPLQPGNVSAFPVGVDDDLESIVRRVLNIAQSEKGGASIRELDDDEGDDFSPAKSKADSRFTTVTSTRSSKLRARGLAAAAGGAGGGGSSHGTSSNSSDRASSRPLSAAFRDMSTPESFDRDEDGHRSRRGRRRRSQTMREMRDVRELVDADEVEEISRASSIRSQSLERLERRRGGSDAGSLTASSRPGSIASRIQQLRLGRAYQERQERGPLEIFRRNSVVMRSDARGFPGQILPTSRADITIDEAEALRNAAGNVIDGVTLNNVGRSRDNALLPSRGRSSEDPASTRPATSVSSFHSSNFSTSANSARSTRISSKRAGLGTSVTNSIRLLDTMSDEPYIQSDYEDEHYDADSTTTITPSMYSALGPSASENGRPDVPQPPPNYPPPQPSEGTDPREVPLPDASSSNILDQLWEAMLGIDSRLQMNDGTLGALRDLLAGSREADAALTKQNQEVVKYLHGLNGWLERDYNDRVREGRNTADTVNGLRNQLANVTRDLEAAMQAAIERMEQMMSGGMMYEVPDPQAGPQPPPMQPGQPGETYYEERDEGRPVPPFMGPGMMGPGGFPMYDPFMGPRGPGDGWFMPDPFFNGGPRMWPPKGNRTRFDPNGPSYMDPRGGQGQGQGSNQGQNQPTIIVEGAGQPQAGVNGFGTTPPAQQNTAPPPQNYGNQAAAPPSGDHHDHHDEHAEGEGGGGFLKGATAAAVGAGVAELAKNLLEHRDNNDRNEGSGGKSSKDADTGGKGNSGNNEKSNTNTSEKVTEKIVPVATVPTASGGQVQVPVSAVPSQIKQAKGGGMAPETTEGDLGGGSGGGGKRTLGSFFPNITATPPAKTQKNAAKKGDTTEGDTGSGGGGGDGKKVTSTEGDAGGGKKKGGDAGGGSGGAGKNTKDDADNGVTYGNIAGEADPKGKKDKAAKMEGDAGGGSGGAGKPFFGQKSRGLTGDSGGGGDSSKGKKDKAKTEGDAGGGSGGAGKTASGNGDDDLTYGNVGGDGDSKGAKKETTEGDAGGAGGAGKQQKSGGSGGESSKPKPMSRDAVGGGGDKGQGGTSASGKSKGGEEPADRSSARDSSGQTFTEGDVTGGGASGDKAKKQKDVTKPFLKRGPAKDGADSGVGESVSSNVGGAGSGGDAKAGKGEKISEADGGKSGKGGDAKSGAGGSSGGDGKQSKSSNEQELTLGDVTGPGKAGDAKSTSKESGSGKDKGKPASREGGKADSRKGAVTEKTVETKTEVMPDGSVKTTTKETDIIKPEKEKEKEKKKDKDGGGEGGDGGKGGKGGKEDKENKGKDGKDDKKDGKEGDKGKESKDTAIFADPKKQEELFKTQQADHKTIDEMAKMMKEMEKMMKHLHEKHDHLNARQDYFSAKQEHLDKTHSGQYDDIKKTHVKYYDSHKEMLTKHGKSIEDHHKALEKQKADYAKAFNDAAKAHTDPVKKEIEKLTKEVGDLREQKKALQYEIGELLLLKSGVKQDNLKKAGPILKPKDENKKEDKPKEKKEEAPKPPKKEEGPLGPRPLISINMPAQ